MNRVRAGSPRPWVLLARAVVALLALAGSTATAQRPPMADRDEDPDVYPSRTSRPSAPRQPRRQPPRPNYRTPGPSAGPRRPAFTAQRSTGPVLQDPGADDYAGSRVEEIPSPNSTQPRAEEIPSPPPAGARGDDANWIFDEWWYQGHGGPHAGPGNGHAAPSNDDGYAPHGDFAPSGDYDQHGSFAPQDDFDAGENSGSQRGPFYVRGEYLLWWVRGDHTPALVTTSPAGTAQAQAGVLGQPGTSLVFGDQSVNTGPRSGGRVALGGWLNPTIRIEGSYFALAQSTLTYNQTSAGDPILARPFFDVNPGSPTAATQVSNLIAYPGVSSGTVNVNATSTFQGADLYVAKNLAITTYPGDKQHRREVLVGYRFLQLHDNLTIDESVTNTPLALQFSSHDSFRTSNNFNGADFGVAEDFRWGRVTFQGVGRLALGCTSENVTIAGSNSTVGPVGGLLAQPSNIGSYNRNAFALVPQAQLKLGYNVTPRLRFLVGYDLIYWTRVVRAGDQIDTSLNLSQASGGTLTGSARPAFAFHETDLWAQGLSVGGEFRF